MEGRVWWFSEDGEFVERECLLFEAGEYPDKGVTVTEDDLRAIAANSDSEVPVKIEHLAESPFDGALGVVTRLRAVGSQLWGTLRQPVEAWRMAQRAGARALSVALDVVGKRLLETSFVCRPRVANAQVFGEGKREKGTGNRKEGCLVGECALEFDSEEKGAEGMASVRQLTEELIAYLRGFVGGSEEATENTPAAEFAAEREALERERAQLRAERVEQQIVEWKRGGRLRATEKAEALARTLLTSGEESIARFDGASVPLSRLFAQFLEENGPVVPLGEMLRVDRHGAMGQGEGTAARERLIALAQEKARKEGLSYVQSFAAVTTAYPELAQAAREE